MEFIFLKTYARKYMHLLEISEEVKDQSITEIFLCKITEYRARKKRKTILGLHQKGYFH